MELTNNHIQKMKRWTDSEWQLSPTVIVSMGDIITHIETQQSEIEQLRAELERYQAQFNPLQNQAIHMGLTEETTAYLHPELQQQPEPPQESLTPAELGEMAGKSEAVQGSLANQVLKYLASVNEPKTNFEIEDELGSFVTFTLLGFCKDGLIERQDCGYYTITAAGRDYLASLDKPEAERYIIPVRDDR